MELKQSLIHPYDFAVINRKKRQLVEELKLNKNLSKIKVAILGGSTTHELKERLNLFLLKNGFAASFYESEYNRYYEEALYPSEDFTNFKPDIIYLYTTLKNFSTTELSFDKLKNTTQTLSKKFNCPIIINNIEYPKWRPAGSVESSELSGNKRQIESYNFRLSQFIESHKSFYLCDLNYISSLVGLSEWFDEQIWYQYKYAISFKGLTYLSHELARICSSIKGLSKKCLVLDLDHTLWGGVIGDDGIEGIKLGQGQAEGEAYLAFQQYVKSLKESGIILAICSKNEYEHGISGFTHPESILKKEDFAAQRINWHAKSQNIEEIANELNIGLNSIVFIDDNPAERENVKQSLPEVCVPEVTANPLSYITVLDREGYFSLTHISNEDLARHQYYLDNQDRKNLEQNFSNYNDYLKSLEMEAIISTKPSAHIERITQLVNKTNQFNLTVKRFNHEEITTLQADTKKNILFCSRLKDKFGDNGIVSVIMAHIEKEIAHIDLWLMSCRVIKRDLELVMLDYLVKEAQTRGIKELRGYFCKGPKNIIVANHYKALGFELLEKKGEDNIWSLPLTSESAPLNKNLRVSYE